MIACVSPADYNYEETLSTLRYASRAKNISNKPKINEDPKDAMLREYQNEINVLRKMLEKSGGANESTVIAIDIEEQMKQEKSRLEKEFDEKAQKLRKEHEQQRREKEELIQSNFFIFAK